MNKRNVRLHGAKGKNFAVFMASKGYYLVLIVSAVLVCAAAFAAVRSDTGSQQPDASLDSRFFGDITEDAEPGGSIINNESGDNKSQVMLPKTDVTEESGGNPKPVTEGDDILVAADAKPEQVKEKTVDTFLKPVEGELLAAFSSGELVFSKTMLDYRSHDGLDISAKGGTEVRAAFDGVVEGQYYDDMWGEVLVISHNGDLKTVYKGMSQNIPQPVKPNAKISRGQVIGYVGDCLIESALNPHLHFELQYSGKPIDPTEKFKK